jgi:hypothetical protein
MKKIMIHLVGAALFIGMAASVYGAVRAQCTVKEVKGNEVILDCGEKNDKIKVGDIVKLRVKEIKPIEGC